MPKHAKCSNVKQVAIIFDIVDEFLAYQNQRFTVILNIKKDDHEITLDFPALNWQQSVVGYLRSVNALPEKLRPNKNLPLVNILASSLTNIEGGYNLQIRSDGSFVIAGLDDQPLPVGPNTSHPSVFSYLIEKLCWSPPKNFEISNGFTETSVPAITGNQLLDWYRTSSYDDRVAFCWADNSAITNPNLQLNTYARTGNYVQGKHGKKLVLNPIVPVITAVQGITMAENSITINPTNKDNILLTTNYRDANQATITGNRFQLWRAVSFDGGLT